MSLGHPRKGALREILGLLYRHRQLTWEMTKREFRDRYAGQALGVLWVVGHPIVLMMVYVFVFAFVFKVDIGGTEALPLDYTVYLLSGLIPWLACQEVLGKGTVVITSHKDLVKQVVFPIEVLPVCAVLSSILTQLLHVTFLSAYVLIALTGMPWTYLLLPLVVGLQALFLVGISYLLSALGAYVRDLKDVVQVFCVVGLFIMPIFYLPDMVPDMFKWVLYANPFSYMAWCYQDVLFFGRFEHPWAWGVYAGLSVTSFYVGYRSFRRLKTQFGNVL